MSNRNRGVRASDKHLVVSEALTLANDVAEGRVDLEELDRIALADPRENFAMVNGPDDLLWPLHLDVCRQVLAIGGIPAGELSEWAATQRRAEGVPAGEAIRSLRDEIVAEMATSRQTEGDQ